MKKNFLSLGLIAAAAFTLTNCTQEIANPVEPSVDGVPFEIVASPAETKTVNNELKTVWADGDALNVFHQYSSNEEPKPYISDGEFKFDAENNVFKGFLGEDLEEEAVYNWYAIYPYSSYIKTPANTNAGYSYIGSRSDKSQKQTGNNSMAHIAGSDYPLVGVCKDWEYYAGEPVQIQMNHASSLLEVVVTNNAEEDLLVENISFTAPENIVGTFYVNFAGESLAFTDAQYVSKTANLEVENGAALAKGESAKFYLAVKPFVANAGDKLTLSVNGLDKKITPQSAVEFKAGKIKTLNFSYVEQEIPEGTSVVEILASASGIANEAVLTTLNSGLLTFAKGTNENTDPKYYDNGTAFRMYTGNTLKVKAPAGCVLTKVVFAFVSSEYATSLECTSNINYEDGVWEGTTDELLFKVTGSAQTRITKITVFYKSGEVPAAEVSSIQVVDPKVEYFKDTEFIAPQVISFDTNGDVETVTGAQFSGYNISTVGQQTVTVTYGNFTTSYVITVALPAGDEYVKFSGELVEGDYIIVYGGGAMNTTVSSSRLQYLDVEINNNAIFSPSEEIIWHIAKSGNYWTLYNAKANKYAASTGAKNKAQMLASGTDDQSLWTVTGTNTYEFVNKKNAANNVNKNLRRNGTYGFACYATSTGGALTLYKKK